MKAVLLGTAGYRPNDKRHTSCIMLPESGVLLDAGTGLYRATDRLQTDTLDIFLTHAHLDHVFGLTVLYDVVHEKPLERITVHGEAKKLAAIDRHLFSEELFPVRPPYRAAELKPEVKLIDGAVVTHFPLEHPGGSVGYRIDWPDRSIAYVTDTTADIAAPYVKAIRGVDLLIHECHLPDGAEKFSKLTGHSCTTPVAQVAATAEVGQLVLMHFNPLFEGDDPIGIANAKAVFPNTVAGWDNMEVDF